MKKAILVVAMVFAIGSLVNANTSEAVVSEHKAASCADNAWAYGTVKGDSEYQKYKATNWYYTKFC